MQAPQMSMVFLLPSVFFSGFIFPRETMPWIFYWLGALFPTTYFIALMRAIILRGANFLEYWRNLLVLILMSNLLFSLCAVRVRRKNAWARRRVVAVWRSLLFSALRIPIAVAGV